MDVRQDGATSPQIFPSAWVFGKVCHADCSSPRWLAGGDLPCRPPPRPAHVHVIGAKGEAVFVLNCPDGPPSLRESYGFSRREELRIQKDLAAHLSTLCQK